MRLLALRILCIVIQLHLLGFGELAPIVQNEQVLALVEPGHLVLLPRLPKLLPNILELQSRFQILAVAQNLYLFLGRIHGLVHGLDVLGGVSGIGGVSLKQVVHFQDDQSAK